MNNLNSKEAALADYMFDHNISDGSSFAVHTSDEICAYPPLKLPADSLLSVKKVNGEFIYIYKIA